MNFIEELDDMTSRINAMVKILDMTETPNEFNRPRVHELLGQAKVSLETVRDYAKSRGVEVIE